MFPKSFKLLFLGREKKSSYLSFLSYLGTGFKETNDWKWFLLLKPFYNHRVPKDTKIFIFTSVTVLTLQRKFKGSVSIRFFSVFCVGNIERRKFSYMSNHALTSKHRWKHIYKKSVSENIIYKCKYICLCEFIYININIYFYENPFNFLGKTTSLLDTILH